MPSPKLSRRECRSRRWLPYFISARLAAPNAQAAKLCAAGLRVLMFRIVTFLIAAIALVCTLLLGAETSWSKVKDLKTGAELRIYKTGARKPMNATFYDATDDRLIIATKDQQIAVPKGDIDRIDARPVSAPRKPSVEKTQTQTDPDYTPGRPFAGPSVPGSSSSSNVSWGNKPNFETIYLRSEGTPKK